MNDYAAAVVELLRPSFPGLPDTAESAVRRMAAAPDDMPEYIVDDPVSARWRLKPDRQRPGRVRLAYFPVTPPGSETAREFERTVNEALQALEDSR